ncbi:MAG: glycosyltransferase family 4 protein [Clostridiaceae bacterium]|nr:glycosyltransferase family 4 protein [Clostridiaceae bacterium]
MNIVFLSIGGLQDLGENTVYPDLLRHFRDQGHSVYVVCQRERRSGLPTEMNIEHGMKVLRVKTGNITKTGRIEKGISTFFIGMQFKKAIQEYFGDVKFDLVLYSTPPITVTKTVAFLKKRDGAASYLMLKDFFPQNACDIGLLKKTGWTAVIYRYFRRKEKQLYLISDYIGCMSQANVDFLLKHNPYLDPKRVEICPNTINPRTDLVSPEEREKRKRMLRARFSLPSDKLIFVYGGNFGKPQDVDYIVRVLKDNEDNKEIHFVMVGSGTDFYKLKEYKNTASDEYITVLDSLRIKEYYELLEACDVGLIFLDRRFTVPNFPSRILDYMNHGLPVLAATDKNTDVKDAILEGDFGRWCESGDTLNFKKTLKKVIEEKDKLSQLGENGRRYLEEHFHTRIAYERIMRRFGV